MALNIDKQELVKEKSKEFLSVFMEFNRALYEVKEQELAIDNFKAIVRGGLMPKYYRKMIGFNIALELYRLLVKDARIFIAWKGGFIKKIKPLDEKLAEKIEALRLPQNEELEILSPLRGIINNEQLVIIYVKTHYDKMMQEINRIKDTKSADELRSAITLLSNKEVEELLRCVNDIRGWPYRAAIGMDWFMERPILYMTGGKSKYDGESFSGFRMYFKDLDLVKAVAKTPEIRRLLTYKEEIKFFDNAKSVILYALKNLRWEGFLGKGGFLWNLHKGPKYIEKVRDEYGNKEFADFLSRLHGKIHENPKAWIDELAELGSVLIKRAYPLVIQPAANALIRIFEARIKELEGKKASAIKDLQKLLTALDLNLKIKKEFTKILRKKKKELLTNFDNLRSKLEKKSEIADASKMEFVHDYKNFIENEMNFSEYADRLEAMYDRMVSTSQEFISHVGSAKNEAEILQPLAKYGVYLDSMDDLGTSSFSKLGLTTDILGSTIKKLNGYITMLENIFLYNKELIGFISERLDDEFTIKLEDLKNMRLQYYKKPAEDRLAA